MALQKTAPNPALFSRTQLAWGAYLGMFTFGVELAVLAAVLPSLTEELQLSASQGGGIFLALNAGSLLVTFLAGPAFDRFGFKALLTVFAVGGAAAVLGAANAPSFGLLFLCSFAMGMGGGGLNSGTSTLIADLFPESPAPALSRLGIFFALGATFIPLLAGSLTVLWTWRAVVIAAAGIAFVPAAWFALSAFPPSKHAAGGFSWRAAFSLIGNPLILLTGLLLFFESGNEVTCGAWLTTHMVKGVGLSASAGAFYLSGLWGGVILGRLAAPWMLRRLDEARLVQASGVSSFLALAFLLAFPGPRLAAFSAIWLGISFSAVFPAVLGLAARRFRDVSGTAFGILMGIALTGGMLFPWLTGHVVQVSDTTRGLMIPAAGFVVVLAIQTLLRRRYFAGTGSTRG